MTVMTKFSMALRAALAAALVAAAASCSVKEDRSDAPVWMRVDRSHITGSYGGPFVFSEFKDGELFFRDWFKSVKEFLSQRYMPLPQGLLDVSGIGGIDGMYFDRDSLLLIPEGGQADALYAFESTVNAYGDLCALEATFHKEYSKVTLDMMASGDPYPYGIRIRSNVCGINARTLKPVEGENVFSPAQREPGLYVFNLLRQFPADDSVSPTRSGLKIEVWGDEGLLLGDPTQPAASTGYALLDVIDLGAILHDNGIVTWLEEDLPDIEVRLDYARLKIYIKVEDWVVVDLGEIEV